MKIARNYAPAVCGAALLCFTAVAQCDAQAASGPYSRQEGDLWIAGNESIEVAVSRTSGAIKRLVDRASKEDYCNQNISPFASDSDGNTATEFQLGERIAGVTLIDELTNRKFSDLNGTAKVSAQSEKKDGDSVSFSFDKHFPGAEFVVRETFRVSADHIRWDVRVHKTAGKDRTIRVIQFAPLPLGHFQGWAPIADAFVGIIFAELTKKPEPTKKPTPAH